MKLRKRRKDKNHRGRYKAKKKDSNNSGNKKEYLIKTGSGSFKVFLDPNSLIKPGRFIKFYAIGGEKTFLRNQISITRIK
jgi:hypothetical protein